MTDLERKLAETLREQAGKVTPKIRLTGRWLERAGFKPGHRVEVRLDEPGKLTLCFSEQPHETTR